MTWLVPSFQFGWDGAIEGLLSPTLITAQCETLHITWSRGSKTGPLPEPPYSITIYSSAHQEPITVDAGEGPSFDLTIPFAPGTKYILCMYDKNGYSGSCQHLHTVYPSVTPLPETCSNFTFPERRMNVSLPAGATSDTAWPNACSYLSFLPEEGIPPYYFTAVGSARRPFNMTIDSARNFTWQIAMDHATPFFVSLEDSSGLKWMHGRPLHAGYRKGNDITCLAEIDGHLKPSLVVTSVAATALGTFLLGAMLASLIHFWLRLRHRQRKSRAQHDASLLTPFSVPPSQVNIAQTSSLTAPHTSVYNGKPSSLSGARSSSTTINRLGESGTSSDPPRATGSKVYVVHHDSEDDRRASEVELGQASKPPAGQDRPPLYTRSCKGNVLPVSNVVRPQGGEGRLGRVAPPNPDATAAMGKAMVSHGPPGNERVARGTLNPNQRSSDSLPPS